MRTPIALIPLLLIAGPAMAAPPPQVPPQLTDPATVDRLANVMQALSKAFLDMPVGQVQAAVEGRPATAADKQRRMRDLEPGLDREVELQIAQSKPMIESSMKAMAEAMPAVMKSLHDARKSLERAAANMPDPTYPKR